ncbi:MAG: tRNA (N6-threonylcarbamoyladenosine(37)-N6)-methyltransferase TrmO [Syntrophales bacterium]|nr:tRNA (N6-threonylcarbamoyladenosine(37)-N6)-methyltransferase TrmO [Syntrophales bacterium]MDD5640618.1 tRNA (N6-threonylcarbamoyladenosine(37)-N6)-methyltransferase TrmO [Syntrophales bacterium]
MFPGLRWVLVCWVVVFLALAGTTPGQSLKGQKKATRSKTISDICLHPIGLVKKQGKKIFLEILPQYAPALEGLSGFSHVWVFYWFHGHDNPEDRATLKVHPRRNPKNPLTGVFATRAPVRPNLIGFSVCRILKVSGTTVEVAELDALEDSPILDLKPYIPQGDSFPDAGTPDWIKRIYPK